MPQTYVRVTFVDVDPSVSSVRAQELLQSKARSHAAHISHPSNRNSIFQKRQSPAGKPDCPKVKKDEYHGGDDKRLHRKSPDFKHFIPKHKGNSDPFNSTAVPYTPQEYALVKWSRAMQIVTAWPSDVKMRQNMPKML